jgi:hypothetical protein
LTKSPIGDRKRPAEAERLARQDRAHRNRPRGGAGHQPVDIGVIGHVERTARTGRDRDAEQRDEAGGEVDVPRRRHEAGETGEDHERHHARLEQREIVADRRDAGVGI